jgi:molybdopterin converting factor subunit 1
MKILFFAAVADHTNCREFVWNPANEISVDELWQELEQRFPGMDSWRATCRLAVNHEYHESGQCISPDAEVGLIPPVSGG